MTPSVAAKYHRLVRWAGCLHHLHTGEPMPPAGRPAPAPPLDLGSILDAVPAAGKHRKKRKDAPASAPGAAPAPAPVPAHPFARVDLRVGRVVRVEKHPNADRLYIEHVDLGEAAPRVVVSGLVEHVEIGELQDRLCVFVCNLKPATLCKTLSSAMLLVAKNAQDNSLQPLIPPAASRPGDRVVIEDVTRTLGCRAAAR